MVSCPVDAAWHGYALCIGIAAGSRRSRDLATASRGCRPAVAGRRWPAFYGVSGQHSALQQAASKLLCSGAGQLAGERAYARP